MSPYFEYKDSPCISYSYTRAVANKIFNYKTSLQQIFQSLSQNPLPCSCSGSEFLYDPCGHIVRGDLNIVRNDKLRDLLRKGPKYREPVSFSWHHNFDIIMDACEAYARRWAKKEDVELDTLSELIKSIGDVLKRRIRRLKHSVNTSHESIFRDPDVVTKLSSLYENFVIVPADKASNNYTFVCKRYYDDILIEELGLNDWKNEFLRIIDIRIDNFTKHQHLFNQPSIRSVKSLKKKMEKLHLKYVIAPADKAANNVIIIWKRHYVEVLKGELNSTSTYATAQLTKDQLLVHHINTLTKIDVKIDKCELPTFYWLPKLHKRPYKSRFISNSSHCSTTILSKHITSPLTAVKYHVIKYSETTFSNSNVNYFWSIKNSSEVIEKLRLRNFRSSQVSSFDFSTLYTSLPHDLIKTKVLSLVNWCFNRESKTYLCTSDKAGFFSNKKYDSYKCWSCAELCEAFTFLMENIYVPFDCMIYQQIVGIPMGTNCAPLIADLFLHCYEKDFMSDLQKSKRFDLIDMFNDTSRYLDDIFTIDNPEFEKHIPDIYPAELQLNKANTSDKKLLS